MKEGHRLVREEGHYISLQQLKSMLYESIRAMRGKAEVAIQRRFTSRQPLQKQHGKYQSI